MKMARIFLLTLVALLSSLCQTHAEEILDSIYRYQDPLVYTTQRHAKIAEFCEEHKIPYLHAYEGKPGNFARFAAKRHNFSSTEALWRWLSTIPENRIHAKVYIYTQWRGRQEYLLKLHDFKTRNHRNIELEIVELATDAPLPPLLKKLFTYYQRTENSSLYIVAPGYFALGAIEAQEKGLPLLQQLARGELPLRRGKKSYIPEDNSSLIKAICTIFLPFPSLLLMPLEAAAILAILFLLDPARRRAAILVGGLTYSASLMLLAPFAAGQEGGFLGALSALLLVALSCAGLWVMRFERQFDKLSQLAKTHLPEVEFVEAALGLCAAIFLLFICREPVRYVGDLIQSTGASWTIWLVIGLILTLPRLLIIAAVGFLWKNRRTRELLEEHRGRSLGILMLLQLLPLLIFYGTTL